MAIITRDEERAITRWAAAAASERQPVLRIFIYISMTMLFDDFRRAVSFSARRYSRPMARPFSEERRAVAIF